MLKNKSILIAIVFLAIILVAGCVSNPELDEKAEKIKNNLITAGFKNPTVSLTCDTLSLTVQISTNEFSTKSKALGEALGAALEDNLYVDNVALNINMNGQTLSFTAKTDDVIDFALGKITAEEFLVKIGY